jgi:hypothetical protein
MVVRGLWAVAKTWVDDPYPCRCWERSDWGAAQCGTRYCPCWMRADIHPGLPADCCAWRSLSLTTHSVVN